MSSIASAHTATLQPTRLPSLSAAKAAGGSSLGSGSATTSGTSSASGDTTSYATNADGSLSITVSNAQGQIVSVSTTQATGSQQSALFGAQSQAAGALLNRLV